MRNTSASSFEQELLLAHILGVSREYVLSYPKISLSKSQNLRFQKLLKRRQNHEPLAYILGHKEFYGLDFKVDKNTLIPRPETEMLVELATRNIKHACLPARQGTWNKNNKIAIVDVGTGSGNIVISLAKELEKEKLFHAPCYMLYGTDISQKALRVAKRNAQKHNVDKKIKFAQSNLLDYFIKNKKDLLKIVNCKLIIVSNLPYLSKKIYNSTAPDIKNFEPRSALLSNKNGLAHYEKLFKQIKILFTNYYLPITAIMEFSPEQKPPFEKMIKKYFPEAKTIFKKDLADKWRVAVIEIRPS